ncbi:MAG: hypothetical protein ACE5EQ_02095 [Phycisphaerae bacterium]
MAVRIVGLFIVDARDRSEMVQILLDPACGAELWHFPAAEWQT